MNEKREESMQKIYKIIMLIILTAFLTFMITSLTLYSYFTKNSAFTLVTGKSNNPSLSNTKGIDNYLNKIKTLIDKNFLWQDDIDNQKLLDSAIQGYVNGLGDKYTEYIPASEMDDFKQDITGSFTGIGVYMVADEETQKIIVYYPIPDSPAEKAGIKAGDVIISVDGVEYGYNDFGIIGDKIKGEENTTVKLVIDRNGERKEFEIARKKIETNPITSKMVNNNIGYIKFPSFDENSSKKFKEKADDLISQGAKSLIIDLRNNGGGIVDESTKIVDYFLDKDKPILTSKDKNGNEEITKTTGEQTYNLPVVILANANTASASEIFIGALKDNERAQVIGKKTYGKGVIQTVITLSDGSALKITTAQYFTPNGIAINNMGIQPDIEVDLPDTVKSVYLVQENEDTQLKKAIEELSK